MKIMLHVIAGCFLLAGCIKHPPTPPGPQPEWLLERIIATDAYQIDFDPTVYSKFVSEYSYRNNKPWRCIHSTNYLNGLDTLNLSVTYIDSLFYDNQGRVTQVINYSMITQQRSFVEKYFYNGNDQLPATTERYNDTNPAIIYTSRYSYTDTSVTVIKPYFKGGFDTTTFAFDLRGNYVMRYYSTNPGFMDFWAYDNAPNPGRFLNVENALPFHLNFDARADLPRFSKNNWTRTRDSQWDGFRIITVNSSGLTIQTALPHHYSVPERFYYRTRYEYRHAN